MNAIKQRLIAASALFLVASNLYGECAKECAPCSPPPLPECNFVSVAGMKPGFFPECGWGVSVMGQALLWCMTEGGLEYAVLQPNVLVPTTTLVSGTEKVISPNYNWGFRVGLGYDTTPSHWDIDVVYTYFYTNFHSSLTAPSGGSLVQTFTDSASNSSVTKVSTAYAKARINYNVLDAEFSRPFLVTKDFLLSPMTGLRTAWVYEKVNADYAGNTVPSGLTQIIQYKNNFWGIGAMAGLESQWLFCYGLSFYGNIITSLLAGNVNLSALQTTGSTISYDVTDHYQATKNLTDLGFGFRWNYMFCNNMVDVGIQVGWEQHLLSNYWQWSTPATLGPNGDLGAYGWNFGAYVNF